MFYRSIIESPVGQLQAYATETHLVGLLWPGSQDARFKNFDREVAPVEHPVLRDLKTQLDEYFSGRRLAFDLPLAPEGTAFQRMAWRALQSIPYGQTKTYSQQAEAIGRPQAVRAIGAANGQNPISIVIPCHRVVGKNGSLTGFAGGLEIKQQLLDLEAEFSGSDSAKLPLFV